MEECQDLLLQGRQFGREDLHDLTGPQEGVAFREAEESQHLFGGRPFRLSLLGVKGQLRDLLSFHGPAQIALDQSLDQEREEVEGKERFDPALVLEQDRGDLVHGLDLLETFLDRGLALVGLEDLRSGEGPIVAQKRVHPVTLPVVVDRRLLQLPLQIPAPARDPAVGRLGSGPSSAQLPEGVLFPSQAPDAEVAGQLTALENLLDPLVDLGSLAQARLRTAEAFLQIRQLFLRGGQASREGSGARQTYHRSRGPPLRRGLGRSQTFSHSGSWV